MDEQPRTQQSLMIPIAIIIGFGLIAVAIYFSGSGGRQAITAPAAGERQPAGQQALQELAPIRAVSADDHIRGNPNAEIVLVEYSDYDCPFCKRFHDTMRAAMIDHGSDGTLAWVYRHMPIQNLHPNAPAIAHASECVAELGGNEAFWEFSDLYYDSQGEISDLLVLVDQLELDRTAIEACMDEQRHITELQTDLAEAAAAGGRGTPFNVFIFAEPMSEDMKDLVREINTQRGGDAFEIISDTQLSMKGAFGNEFIDQIIQAYNGISL